MDVVPASVRLAVLAGYGDKNDRCGVKQGINVCGDCNEWHSDQVYHCDRPECPICWPYWAAKQAKRFVDRLVAAKVRFGLIYKAAVVSPPKRLWHLSYGELRTEYNRIVQEAGAVGGGTIVHLARFRGYVDGDRIRWKNCSLNPKAVDVGQAAFPEYAPHFHCVLTGWLLRADKFWAKFGWTYKNLGDLETERDMFGYVWYCLSHVMVVPGRKVVSYFGINRPGAQVVVGKQKTIEIVLCEKCHGTVHKHDVRGNRLKPLRKVTITTEFDFPEFYRKGKKLVRSYRRRDRITDWVGWTE